MKLYCQLFFGWVESQVADLEARTYSSTDFALEGCGFVSDQRVTSTRISAECSLALMRLLRQGTVDARAQVLERFPGVQGSGESGYELWGRLGVSGWAGIVVLETRIQKLKASQRTPFLLNYRGTCHAHLMFPFSLFLNLN